MCRILGNQDMTNVNDEIDLHLGPQNFRINVLYFGESRYGGS